MMMMIYIDHLMKYGTPRLQDTDAQSLIKTKWLKHEKK